MKKSQFFAVSQWLTDWPDGWSFESIINAVYIGDDQITRWEMVENWSNSELSEAIEMCEKSFSRAVDDLLNEDKIPSNGAFGSPFPANFLSIRK